MPRLSFRVVVAFAVALLIANYLPRPNPAISPSSIVAAVVVPTVPGVTFTVALNKCVTKDLFVLTLVSVT
jgi:uncharacterized membrane protein YjjP (DUF1212 family)